MTLPRICFLGLDNLAVLSPDHAHLPAGGEPVQQTLLARALARRGFDVSMVVASLGQPDGATFDGIRTFGSFDPDAGIPILRFIHPRWTSVMAQLRRVDADVYYTSCASTGVAQIVRAARALGAGSVFRIASDSDCDPARLLIRLWRDRKIYEHGLARVDRILAQSAFQSDLMRRNYQRDSRVAGMLVEPAAAPAAFSARQCDALWVSNIRQVKRPDILLQVAGEMPDLSFHMVGGPLPGAEAMFDEVGAAARALPNLEFAGLVPYRRVSRAYAQARVFVNTSDVEGFPNSFLQAWINGVPVVSFFDPDGVIAREGLGVAVRSRAEMLDAIRRLATQEDEWLEASRRCLAFMSREFAEDTILEPYLQTFMEVGGRAASRA
jgi:glycosyltransferase involved in cell wall biosynthesis